MVPWTPSRAVRYVRPREGRLVILQELAGHGFVAVAMRIRGTKTIGFGCAIGLEGQTAKWFGGRSAASCLQPPEPRR